MAAGDELSLETLTLSGAGTDAAADHLDAVRRCVIAGDADRYLSALKQHSLVAEGASAEAPLVYLMEWFHTWQQEYEAFVHVLEAEEDGEDEASSVNGAGVSSVEKDLAEMEAEAEVLMEGFGAIAAALLEALAIDSPDSVVDKHGWTLLMQAANSGLRELADVLIASGADVNGAGRSSDATNPLYLAVESEHTSIALALLKKGAAASATQVVKTHKPLLGADDGGANADDEEEEDDDCAFFQACRFGHLDVIEEMLASDVDVNFAVPSSGDRALHVAVMFEMQDVAERLVACDKIELNALNASGQTCLFGCSNLELVQMLVAKGVDPDVKDEDGETAYSMAAALGDDDVAQFLKPLTH